MAEDSPPDISLNIYSSPLNPEDVHKVRRKVKKGSKSIRFKEKVAQTVTKQKRSEKEGEDEIVDDNQESPDNQEIEGNKTLGRQTSLFCHNPEIPAFARRVVKPVSERVFSSQDFKDLPIHPFTVSNLDQNLGLQKLTTVQQKAIPLLLSGSDAMIRSQTGSGKTLAYALPIIEELQKIRPKISRGDGVQAVVVVPTRELALQTYEWFIKLVKPFTWIVPGYLVGGEKRKAEKARLRKGITILIGTPGRLLDHVEHTKSLKLDRVAWLILDEADRLLDMGYEKEIARFIEALDSQQSGTSRHTVLLSATLTSAVEKLAGLTLKSPEFVDAADNEVLSQGSAADLVIPNSLIQFYVLTPPKLRLVTLSGFIVSKCKFTEKRKMLVFCATQDMVDFHTELLAQVLGGSDSDESGLVDIEFFKLHGNMTQKERTDVFKTFRAAESGVLLCTDVAARGLDLPHVDWIVQYTAPSNAGDYVHRVGRTARVGTAGAALLFLAPSEVQFIRQLEDRRIRLQEKTMELCLRRLCSVKMGRVIEEAATTLQTRYETAVLEQKHLHDLACKAYVSWVRFYASYRKEAREAFNFKEIHLGHYAKSFALRDPPAAIGGIGRRNWQKNKQKKDHDNRRPSSGKRTMGHSTRDLVTSEFASGLEPMRKKKRKM